MATKRKGVLGPYSGKSCIVTREADYALRCILYLSDDEKAHRSVREISSEMHIPESFLAKILQRLMKAGVVASVRGAGGGFKLSKPASEITVLGVMEAIDGPLVINRCAVEPGSCDLSGECVIHPLWVILKSELERRFEKLNFKDLAAKRRSGQRKKEA